MPQEEVLKRVMPHSLEAEQSVIGKCTRRIWMWTL